ncbi:MAG: aspartate aminotransferase family protein [bacterium]|nr:aspartate aminotransferase family protein [bacterium]
MSNGPRQWQNYTDILEQLKTFFPVPTSNPIMDGYFVHTISNFLDRVDSLKSAAPILGIEQERRYENSFQQGFPEKISSVEEMTKLLADYCQGMIIWAHPNCQAQVIAPPTIPSIMAFMAGAIYNPNILSDEYSGRFAEAEVQAIAMLCDLVGYDPKQAGGIFTFGGTGTILYGCKLGLEKLFGGQVMSCGVRGEGVKIVTSEASHYSRLNVAGWLGIGTKNVVTIPSTANNEMSLIDLENYLRRAFERKERIAAIIATLGTTDAFGIDDLAAIVHLRDQLAKEYGLEHPPHVHADSVIGWAWLTFRDYDFQINPLGLHARTIRSLQDSVQRISALSMADSLGIDFHKTGYAPYISSVFMVKNRSDLNLLSRDPAQMPYLYRFGHYNPGIYTLECSRSGASALAALANMRLLGKQGYRAIIGHVVEMSEMLRERLESYPFVEVLNDYNYGPVTLFRVYPDGVDPALAFQREQTDPDYCKQLQEHNAYNRRIFERIHQQAMAGEGVLLSWTDAYRHAGYDERLPIAAIKSFIMSPWTGIEAVETVARQVARIREQI